MAERGATPKIPKWRRRALHAVRSLFTPLLPGDYLELINPLWSTRELRGRIESIEPETADAVTIVIKPGWEWEGHEPGQYLRVGFRVNGVHHWRAYSLTSDPGRPDGCISITPKLLDSGKVTPYLVRKAQPGVIVRLGGVEGTFKLPDPPPRRILFVTAGSGITPVMSMLRHLDRCDALDDVVHLHSAHTEDELIFGDQLRALDARRPGYSLHLRWTGEQGRLTPERVPELCPDWRERETFACGPGPMLDALGERWEAGGLAQRFHFERFQPVIGGHGDGAGGTIRFRSTDLETECDGDTPILVAGEAAGAELPFGCRMGVCHTCIGRLCSGRIRDLRSGAVSGVAGELVRTCIHAPEGPIEIDL